ncbi:hypothetical protein KKC13_09940 [bacterium]|nr:hypothetical protein [bacterium]MBU1956949.1 hypothetical protein [bacterium]
MKKIFKLTLITLTATLLTGCCLIDHTKTIEKVAEPMLKELQQFYEEYKRYPNTKERDVMLERSGCKMNGNVCFFEKEELRIIHSIIDSKGDYYIRIRIFEGNPVPKNSLASCRFGIYKNGVPNDIGCSKRACLDWRQ